MSNNYKIGIRGGYGLYNFGDDALIVALYQNLLSNNIPKDDIILLCTKSNYLNKQLNNPRILDYNSLDSSIQIDHLIYGGGTQFYSFNQNNQKKIKDIILNDPIQIFSKIKNQITLFLRKRYIESKFQIADYAKNIYLIGVGVGPFSNENILIESKTANLFRKSKFISVRDQFSFKKCSEWGINEYMKSPDLCYIIDVSAYLNKSNSLKKIGVIVRDWNHTGSQNYYDKIIAFVKKLRNEHYEVVFISMDKKSDIYWAKYFRDHKENYIQWDADKMTFEEFYALLSQFDLHITARFHGAVFASMFHIPFISIEVEQKLKMIAGNYEGGAYCWESDFDLTKLDQLVNKVKLNYLSHKDSIVKNTTKYKEVAEQQYQELIKKICKN